MIDDAAIRAIVVRLARPSASGAHTIERAAILAEGSECAEIEAWIVRQGGEPHAASAARGGRARGLHAERAQSRSSPADAAPSRYVLPASSLA
jgi:hypothetical protein